MVHMGSGLNFRSRPIDIDRALSIYEEYELPDLFDACLVNRTLTKVPTGMEKEEESEIDLQKALIAQKNNQKSSKALIPVPEVFIIEIDHHAKNVEIPPMYIGEELVSSIDEISNYDMNGDDIKFINRFVTYAQHYHDNSLFSCEEFESMMELMEATYKSTKNMERVMQLIDKKQINKYVFQHWEKKRKFLKPYHMLVPTVRTCDKKTQNDPFVAFRKRIEKMQTRKNRKLDEVRYTNAFRIAHSLFSSTDILDKVTKRENLKLSIENNTGQLFYLRYNNFVTTNYTIENVLIDESNRVDIDLKNESLIKKSIKNSFINTNRRISKNNFWRRVWKSSSNIINNHQIQKPCSSNNPPVTEESSKISIDDNIHKNTVQSHELYKRNPVKRHHRLLCTEPQACLLPLRDRPPFKPQSRDEFIRKLYFAQCVKEHFIPSPRIPDGLRVPVSSEIGVSFTSVNINSEMETINLPTTNDKDHLNSINIVLSNNTLLSNHFKIDDSITQAAGELCQPSLDNIQTNSSLNSENDFRSPYLLDSESAAMASITNNKSNDTAANGSATIEHDCDLSFSISIPIIPIRCQFDNVTNNLYIDDPQSISSNDNTLKSANSYSNVNDDSSTSISSAQKADQQ